MTRYATLALAAAVATFVLISVGGLVRATDSGLACPNWPGCFAFNDWIPPAQLHVWIEHTHRLVASLAVGPLVGIVGIWTLLSRDKRRDLPLLAAAIAAGVLVIVQSVIGRSVVMEGLAAELVSVHLGMALTVFAATIFIAERAAHGPLPARSADPPLLRLGLVTAAAIFAQMLLGSWVTGHGAGLAYADFPLMNGRLVPDVIASQQAVQVLHRALALVVALLVVATFLRVRRATDLPRPRRIATAMLVLVLVQLVLGAANIWSQLSAWFVVPHLAVGSGLWAASVWLALSLRRLRPADVRLPDRVREPGAAASPVDTLRAYIALTKPRIIELLLVTTIPTMVLAQRGVPSLGLMAAVMLGGTLAAGGANTINQVIDRDIDDVMRRTRHRPLPSHAITPRSALTFGIALSIISFVFLAVTVNLLAALLVAERHRVLRLRVHAVAEAQHAAEHRDRRRRRLRAGARGVGRGDRPDRGARAHPVRIVFYWTPPHFWALALRYRGDYAAAGVPMLPVVRGEAETARQIVIYTLLLVAVSLLLFPAAGMGLIYLVAALGLGALFVVVCAAHAAPREQTGAPRSVALPLLDQLPDAALRGGRGRHACSASRSAERRLMPLSDLRRPAVRRGARCGGPPRAPRRPPRGPSPARNATSPTTHITIPPSTWSSSGAGPQRPQVRQVVRIQHGPRVHQRHPEERVLGHGEEQVEEAHRVGQAPRRRVRADDRPPEEEGRGEEGGVLEVVERRVLERVVVEGREVPAPVHRREQEPGEEREAQHPHRQAVEQAQDAATQPRRRGTQDEGDRGAGKQERRRDELQQHVLDHVDAEQRALVGLDRGEEGDRQRGETGDEEPGAPRPRGIAWVRARHPTHEPQVAEGRGCDAGHGQELDAPIEQDAREARRGRGRPVREHGGRDRERHARG